MTHESLAEGQNVADSQQSDIVYQIVIIAPLSCRLPDADCVQESHPCGGTSRRKMQHP